MNKYFISFYWQYSIVQILHILFIYSLIDGRVVFAHFFAIMNTAAMNIHVQLFM